MANEDGLAVEQSSQTVLGGSLTQEESPPAEPNGNAEVQQSGSDQPKWMEQLPREFRDKFTGYQSYKDFVGAAAEAIELKGRAIIKPKDDAPQEEWDRFYTSVGRPSDPNGYGIEGDGVIEGFRKTAHELGLSEKQAKSLYEWYSKASETMVAEANQQESQTATKVQESLKADWGDKYGENMKAIERFSKRYGNAELAKELSNPVIGNNPHLIKAFAKAGMDLAPEMLVTGTVRQQDEKPKGHFEYPWMREVYPTKKI